MTKPNVQLLRFGKARADKITPPDWRVVLTAQGPCARGRSNSATTAAHLVLPFINPSV